jgi:hypothetical protein
MAAGAVLIIDAVEKRVEHHIAAVDTQLCQKPLYSVTGHTDQDASDYRLVLGGVLTNAQHSCRSIQSAAIKDRPPFNAKRIGREDRLVRSLLTKSRKRFVADAGLNVVGIVVLSPIQLPKREDLAMRAGILDRAMFRFGVSRGRPLAAGIL